MGDIAGLTMSQVHMLPHMLHMPHVTHVTHATCYACYTCHMLHMMSHMPHVTHATWSFSLNINLRFVVQDLKNDHLWRFLNSNTFLQYN